MRRAVNGASIEVSQPKRRRHRPTGFYVYAIGDTDARFIKFGQSNYPMERLRTLQTGHPLTLRMLACVLVGSRQDAMSVEYAIHRAAARFFIRGEWFTSCPRTLMIVEWMKLDTARFAKLIADAAYSETKQMERSLDDLLAPA